MNNPIIRRIVIPVCLIVMCGLFVFVGFRERGKKQNYVKTDAVIQRIESNFDAADDSTNHTVFVSYSVDGKSYENELGEYKATFSEGQTVSIRYNPDNPNDITTDSMFSVILLWAGAGICLLAAVVLFVRG